MHATPVRPHKPGALGGAGAGANPRATSSASAYRHVGIETGVSAASPHQLVSLLFDGVQDSIAQARGAIRSSDIQAKGQAISRALRIVDEGLSGALDAQAGGKLARDLRDLYHYIALRLTHANLHNDDAALAECAKLLEPVRAAWREIGDQVQAHRPAAARP